MRYQINNQGAYTRKMKIRVFLRWFFYSLSLLLLYSIMSCGAFGRWQPYFIISLCIGVSMHEQEFASSVFGIFCGFMLDIAVGTLFGFFAVLLMPFCFLTSLLSRNLLKVNFVNHAIAVAVTVIVSFFMYYLFHYSIWNISGREVIVSSVLFPSFIATVLTAPAMYFLTKFIASKFGLEEDSGIMESVEEATEAEETKKEKHP